MTSKVSVIIPVYNVENYLSECLDSVLNQTLEQIEILCINDGSTDSSAGILEKYQKQDSRLSVLNRANSGYGSACNAGLRLAKGEYISIIEPDDFIDCKMFEDLYNLASTNEVDIIKSAFYEYDENIASASDCAKKYIGVKIMKCLSRFLKFRIFHNLYIFIRVFGLVFISGSF